MRCSGTDGLIMGSYPDGMFRCGAILHVLTAPPPYWIEKNQGRMTRSVHRLQAMLFSL